MPNLNAPQGFVPFRHRSGGLIRASGDYKIASGYATAIYYGDAVILSTGTLAIAADNSATLVGIFAGVQYQDSAGDTKFQPYWPAAAVTLNAAAAQAFVYDDPMISYRCQSDTGTAYVDATHKSGTFDIELDNAGSALTGRSGMELDLSDTGTGQFQVIGLIDEPGNAAGVNAKLEVIIKESLLKAN